MMSLSDSQPQWTSCPLYLKFIINRLSSAIKQAPKTNQHIEIKGLLGSQSVSLQSVEESPLALVQMHPFCVPSSCEIEKSDGLGRIRSLLLGLRWECWRWREMHSHLCTSWLALWTLTGTDGTPCTARMAQVAWHPACPCLCGLLCKVELLITENLLRFYLFLFYIYGCFTCANGCVSCACCTYGGQKRVQILEVPRLLWLLISSPQGLKISVLWTLYYGVLSAFAPVYSWILVLRGLVGFGIGGVPQS